MPSSKTKRNKHRKKFTKYNLILDESLPPANRYPKLNNTHSVKHIVHDYRLGGIKDPQVYKLATQESRLVIVFNTKDFKPLLEDMSSSIIALSTNLSNKQADLKICSLLSKLKPSETQGYLFTVSNEGVQKVKLS